VSPPAPELVRTRRVPLPVLTAATCAVLFTVLAVIVAVRHGTPFGLDHSANLWAADHRPPAARTAARAVTATGTGVFPYVCAVVAGVIAAGRELRRRLWAVLVALVVLGLGQAVRYGLMHAIGRPRPPVADWATYASGFAFPSGHSTTSALAAGLLIWAVVHAVRPSATRNAVVAVPVCWAVAVGLSRIYLGVHWVTDVLGGWLFAAAWVCLCAAVVPRVPALRHRPDSTGRRDDG
jgi:undecaprenyl-diphosphatase